MRGLTLLLLVLLGCSSITEGEVYAKRVEPANTFVMMIPICRPMGKTTICTPIPYFMHDDEDYVVSIRAWEDGEWETRDVYVEPETYSTVDVGDFFSVEYGSADDPHTRRRKA